MAFKHVPLGAKYANWTVVQELPNNKSGHVMFLCQCDCGTQKPVAKSQLLRAETRYCWSCYKDTSPSAIYKSRKRMHEEKELDPAKVDVWSIGFK